MSLTDIMSSLGLSVFPQIGLVIFLAIFVAVVLRVFRRDRVLDMNRFAALALEDDAPTRQEGATP